MQSEEFDDIGEEEGPPSCKICGRFFHKKSIVIGRGVCIRCASSGHEEKLPRRRRYNFRSPEVEIGDRLKSNK